MFRVSRPVILAYYVTLAFFTIGALFPEGRVWGINWFTYVPDWMRQLLLLIGVAGPFVVGRLFGNEGNTASEPAHSNGVRFWAISSVSVVGCAALFWLCRNSTHFLGDGYQILSNLTNHVTTGMIWNVGSESLEWVVFVMMGGTRQSQALVAFQLISICSGLATIVAVLWAGRRLGLSPGSTWLLALGMLSCGMSLMYFGYVETYPPVIFVVVATCLFGVLGSEGKMGRWWAPAALVVGVVLHVFCLALAPAVAYLIVRPTKLWERIIGWSILVRILALAIGVAVAATVIVVLAWQDYSFRFMFVPPVADRFTSDGYTLFSMSHLVDLANLLFMLFPASLLFFAAGSYREAIKKSSSYRFLVIALAGSLMVALFFDPKLGMPRDWDMFAFVGVPLALLCFLPLVDRRLRVPGRRSILVLSILLGLGVLGVRVAVFASSEHSLEFVRRISALDRAKSRNLQYLVGKYLAEEGDAAGADSVTVAFRQQYPEAGLHEQALQKQSEGKHEEAIALAWQEIAFNPCYYDPYGVLCVSYGALGRVDDALEAAKIDYALNSRAPVIAYNLGCSYQAVGDSAAAEQYLLRAVQLDSLYGPAVYGLGVLALNSKDVNKARRWLNRLDGAHQITPAFFADLAGRSLGQSAWKFGADAIILGWRHGLDSAAVVQLVHAYPSVVQYLK